MVSRELVVRALNHESVGRPPRDLWISTGAKTSYREEADELLVRYPSDIIRPNFRYSRGKLETGRSSAAGGYTDAWGCTWEAPHKGDPLDVIHPPLSNASRISAYDPPLDIFKGARLGPLNHECESTCRFVLAETQTSPFRRLCLLRGRDAACRDLLADTPAIRKLLAKLHDFFCREMQLWADTEVDGVMLADDFEFDDSTEISPAIWREIFKPLFDEYCKILRSKDKFVFLSAGSSGEAVLGDLIKSGIDAVHLHPMPDKFAKLAKRYRGKVTFWTELDAGTMSEGTEQDVAEAIRNVRKLLDFGSGGLIAKCNWEANMPPENVVSLIENLMQPMSMNA